MMCVPALGCGVRSGNYGDMTRPAKYSVEQILDATADVVAADGPAAVTVATIASRLGAPSGSIYHRFESRDLILARLWIRTVKRAQAGFLEALEGNLPNAAVNAALHIPRWSRRHPAEARVLLLYRRNDLAARWPEELGDELGTLNDAAERGIRGLTRRIYGKVNRAELQTVAFAVVDVPYAAVRRYLVAGRAPPRSIDALVARTVEHLLDL
jgi:AcrR family transcriptional regulator